MVLYPCNLTVILVFTFSFLILCVFSESTLLPEFSLQPPFSPDAASAGVHGWQLRGESFLMEDSVVVSQQNKGLIVNQQALNLQNIEIIFDCYLQQPTKQFDSDIGMALWLTEQPMKVGPIYGANGNSVWNGISLSVNPISDSEDKIIVKQKIVQREKGNQVHQFDIGSCVGTFENRHTSIKIRINSGVIQVSFKEVSDSDWIDCMDGDVVIPLPFYLSISAQSKRPMQFHASSLLVSSINENSDSQSNLSGDEKQKLTDLFNSLLEAETALNEKLKQTRQNIDDTETRKHHQLQEIQELQDRIKNPQKSDQNSDSNSPSTCETTFYQCNNVNSTIEESIPIFSRLLDDLMHEFLDVKRKSYNLISDDIFLHLLDESENIGKHISLFENTLNMLRIPENPPVEVEKDMGTVFQKLKEGISELQDLIASTQIEQRKLRNRLKDELTKTNQETISWSFVLCCVLVIQLVVFLINLYHSRSQNSKKPLL